MKSSLRKDREFEVRFKLTRSDVYQATLEADTPKMVNDSPLVKLGWIDKITLLDFNGSWGVVDDPIDERLSLVLLTGSHIVANLPSLDRMVEISLWNDLIKYAIVGDGGGVIQTMRRIDADLTPDDIKFRAVIEKEEEDGNSIPIDSFLLVVDSNTTSLIRIVWLAHFLCEKTQVYWKDGSDWFDVNFEESVQ